MYKPELMADVGAKSSVNSTRQHLEWRNRDRVCAGCFRCALNGVNIIAHWQKYTMCTFGGDVSDMPSA